MNPSFNLQAPKIYTESAELFIEAGPAGVYFTVLNTGECFQAVVAYPFPNKLTETEILEELDDILQNEPLLKKAYKRTHIIWTYPESILVPTDLFDRDHSKEMLDLVFGDLHGGPIFHDFLYKHNLYNTHRIPDPVLALFEKRLHASTQRHQYSLLADRMMNGGNELFLVFYTGCMTVMLCKEKKLQLIRNFNYNIPDDVAYQLLQVCRSFDIDPASVRLQLSGMVDKKSNLFASIYKYFIDIEFDGVPANHTVVEEIKVQPPHFFSHLFYQALCV